MSVNSLFPAYVEIDYVSKYGFHTMTRPVLTWTGTPFTDGGEFATHAGGTIGALDMISAFLAKLVALFATTTAVVQARIFTMASPTAEPRLVHIINFTDLNGESDATGWDEATQRTYTFQSDEGGLAKLVILDAPGNNSFAPRYTLPALSDDLALADEFSSNDNGWAARDGGRPVAFKKLSNDLNDKLRSEYRI